MEWFVIVPAVALTIAMVIVAWQWGPHGRK